MFLCHILYISLEFSCKANVQLSTGVTSTIISPYIGFSSSPIFILESIPTLASYIPHSRALLSGETEGDRIWYQKVSWQAVPQDGFWCYTSGQMANEELIAMGRMHCNSHWNFLWLKTVMKSRCKMEHQWEWRSLDLGSSLCAVAGPHRGSVSCQQQAELSAPSFTTRRTERGLPGGVLANV